MTLLADTLATELENLVPGSTEPEAIQILVDAYAVYAADAAASTPLLPAGVELGKAAMAPVLTGMSLPGQGLVKIPQAIAAFWVGVAAGLATSFAAATVITPPPHATLPNTFPALMPANTAANSSLAQAATAMAQIIHADAIVGGTVTTPPAVVTPIL